VTLDDGEAGDLELACRGLAGERQDGGIVQREAGILGELAAEVVVVATSA
jgi:hypothetical protein